MLASTAEKATWCVRSFCLVKKIILSTCVCQWHTSCDKSFKAFPDDGLVCPYHKRFFNKAFQILATWSNLPRMSGSGYGTLSSAPHKVPLLRCALLCTRKRHPAPHSRSDAGQHLEQVSPYVNQCRRTRYPTLLYIYTGDIHQWTVGHNWPYEVWH